MEDRRSQWTEPGRAQWEASVEGELQGRKFSGACYHRVETAHAHGARDCRGGPIQWPLGNRYSTKRQRKQRENYRDRQNSQSPLPLRFKICDWTNDPDGKIPDESGRKIRRARAAK